MVTRQEDQARLEDRTALSSVRGWLGRYGCGSDDRSARRFPGGSRLRRRSGGGLDPNSRGSAGFRLLDLESICLSHEVAQLAAAIGPRIEIRGQVGKPF